MANNPHSRCAAQEQKDHAKRLRTHAMGKGVEKRISSPDAGQQQTNQKKPARYRNQIQRGATERCVL
jgi:hypothetical protein